MNLAMDATEVLERLTAASLGMELGTGKNRHYYMKPGVVDPYHRVSTVLNVLGKPALPAWYAERERTMVVELARTSDSHHHLVNALEGRPWAGEDEAGSAADKGTDTHAAVAAWLRGVIEGTNDPGPDHTAPVFDSFSRARRIIEGRGLVPLACEVRLSRTAPNVAGSCDYLFHDPSTGHYVLPDLKTGKRVYDSHAIQLGAYADMLEATCPGIVVEPVILHVPYADENDKGRWIPVPRELAGEAWKATLSLWLYTRALTANLKEATR